MHFSFIFLHRSHCWSDGDLLQTWWAVWQKLQFFANFSGTTPTMGGINRHMPPFNRQKSHWVCLNHPFGIETVQSVEDNTQVSHDAAGGEGGWKSREDMGGDDRIDAVWDGTMMEWFSGRILVRGESDSDPSCKYVRKDMEGYSILGHYN